MVLTGRGYWAQDYWTAGRFMVETDDAYVQAGITEISPRIQGYVAEAPVAKNAHVSWGEVLLRLDGADYRIALDTAKSRVATQGQCIARIDAQVQAAEASVTQAKAQRDAADAALRNADATAGRTERLASGNVVAQAQLDSANEARDTARAQVAAARAAVNSARTNVVVLRA